MKITYFSYNAFLIEDDEVKIAIDPGQNLYLFNFTSLIPESEWNAITHILITHVTPTITGIRTGSQKPLMLMLYVVKDSLKMKMEIYWL